MTKPEDDDIVIHWGIHKKFDSEYLSRYDMLGIQFIKGIIDVYEFIDNMEKIPDAYINWWTVSITSRITEDFAKRYEDKLDWLAMFSNSNTLFSQKFIEENKFRFEKSLMESGRDLTFFINETLVSRIGIDELEKIYSDLWHVLSKCEDLSLTFIKKYQNNLDWKFLSRGRLSDNFISTFAHRLKDYLPQKVIYSAIIKCRKPKLQQIFHQQTKEP